MTNDANWPKSIDDCVVTFVILFSQFQGITLEVVNRPIGPNGQDVLKQNAVGYQNSLKN